MSQDKLEQLRCFRKLLGDYVDNLSLKSDVLDMLGETRLGDRERHSLYDRTLLIRQTTSELGDFVTLLDCILRDDTQ